MGDGHEKKKKKKKSSSKRDRSGSNDSYSRHHKQDPTSSSSKRSSSKRHRSRSRSNETASKKKSKHLKGTTEPQSSMPSTENPIIPEGGANLSLSIEETNKLRIKLGLKPLDANEGPKGEGTKPDFVHVPASNLRDKQQEEKLREKISIQKEKRELLKTIGSVKTLAEQTEQDEGFSSASAWVERSRALQKEKEQKEIKARIVTAAEEEFGLGEILENAVHSMKEQNHPKYSIRDLRGLKVEHSLKDFQDVDETILTLKDSNVLDEDEDVLMNQNLLENKKASRNIQNRSKRTDYNPYGDFDDDTGMFKESSLLSKYDEVIEGEETPYFRLDSHGRGSSSADVEFEKMRESVRRSQVSLDMPHAQVARDYFTPEEMAKFKKPKRKVKVQSRKVLKADDLLDDPLIASGEMAAVKKEPLDVSMTGPSSSKGTLPGISEVLSVDYEEDEASIEYQVALECIRRKTIGTRGTEHISEVSEAELIKKSTLDETPLKRDSIIMDSTSEFCRTLGDHPSADGQTAVKQEPGSPSVDHQGEFGDDMDASGSDQQDPHRPSEELLLEEAHVDSKGIAGALKLFESKGYLSERKKLDIKPKLNLPETKAIVDEDKMRDEAREHLRRERDRNRDRDAERFIPNQFLEKPGYKPDVKLIYVDEKGRALNPKAAFRFQSHKFHGKGSGKLKTAKRENKFLEDMMMNNMNSVDTPLNTVNMMVEKQKSAQSPFIVLSGGGKNLLSVATISKKQH